MKRMTLYYLSLCILCFLGISCKSRNEQALLVRKEKAILARENAYYEIYYNGDASAAEMALRNYIKFLADYDHDVGLRNVCYFGKALALARVELILTYRDSKPIDLHSAIAAFQVFDQSVPKPNQSQIRHALLTMINKDDAGRVPWVTIQTTKEAEEVGMDPRAKP